MSTKRISKDTLIQELKKYEQLGYKITVSKNDNSMTIINELQRLEHLRHIDNLRNECNRLMHKYKVTQEQLKYYV